MCVRGPRRSQRAGVILPLVAISLVMILGFVALAVDIGFMAIARNEAQNAADVAAMAGVRTLNGDVANDNNNSNVPGSAQTAASENKVLNQALAAAQVNVESGSYTYNESVSPPRFESRIPRATGDNFTLVRASIQNTSRQTYFGRVFGMNSFNTTATATAVHRPRDVAIILDFSGSMRFDSLIGIGYSGNRSMSNNSESVFPGFGHYSDTSAAALRNTNTPFTALGSEIYGPANVVTTTSSGNPIVDNFYQHLSGNAASQAFTAAADSFASVPGGDNFRFTANNSSSNYAKTVNELVASANFSVLFELDGYARFPQTGGTSALTGATDYSTAPFNGYTQGPRHWGKSFFLWPPDPRAPLDATQYPGTVTATFVNPSTGVTSTASVSKYKMLVANFLESFGYGSSAVMTTTATDPLRQVWDLWPWATEALLTVHLLTVPVPASEGTGNLTTASVTYQRLLRLHNRPLADWRRQFFTESDGSPLDDNTKLWSSADNNSDGIADGWRNPVRTDGTVNYRVNYDAILAWIASGPNPFPPRLRSGRVLYYDAIPTTINNSTFPPTDLNQRFWKEYIDHVLGIRQTTALNASPSSSQPFSTINIGNSTRVPILRRTGYGQDFTWGTVTINGPQPVVDPVTDGGTNENRCMHYDDNPPRPRTHFWFGPLTMMDFLGNYNEGRYWWPGTCNESPVIGCKLGMDAAIRDIERNHPNDFVSIIYFSNPRNSATDTTGRFNQTRVPLGRDYQRMRDSLWFSPYQIANPTVQIRTYDTDSSGVPRMNDVPNATGSTCPEMGLMLAFNQFSGHVGSRTHSPSPAPAGEAGGLGRRGATKLIVLETDGVCNTGASASVNTTGGGYNSYYEVRYPTEYPGDPFPSSSYPSGPTFDDVAARVYTVTNRICALDTASAPGYSTPARPVLIHALAFGTLFEPTTTDPNKALSLGMLQNCQYIGGQAGGEQTTPTTPELATYKRIIGTQTQRVDRLRAAFTSIMQSGFQVTLID